MLPCPFHMITGYDCPLCGSQRAAMCFIQGNILEGLEYNYALVVMIPLCVIFVLIEFFNKKHRFDSLQRVVYHKWAKIGYGIAFVTWWIVRNLP